MSAQVPGLVGRVQEFALLNGMIGEVSGPGRGGSVVIEGEPGIGKSALLSAALPAGQVGPCAVLRGECDELGQRFPLSVAVRLLGVDDASTDPRRARAARALRRPAHADGWAVRASAGDPVAAAVEQLAELVDRLCAPDPLILVLEDLHWADDATLVLWRRLSRAAVQLPLLLVGTCRPVPRSNQLHRLRRELGPPTGMLIPLGPLTEHDAVRLATEHAGGSPGPGLRGRLRSAAGNPLYLRELISALTRSATIELREGVAELTRDGQVDVSASLSAAIVRRLDFLSPKAWELLRTATLLGTRFSVAELTAVGAGGRVSVVDTVALVHEALDAEVLEQVGPQLRFRHDLLREALYEATPLAIRSVMHQHVTKVLIGTGAPVDRIAETLLPALPTAENWELDWLAHHVAELAGRAPRIAAELLENALAHLDRGDERRSGFEDHLAAVCHLLGRYEQTVRLTRDVLACTAEPGRVGHAVWLLGHTLLDEGQVDDAGKLVDDYLTDNRADAVWTVRITALKAAVSIRQACFDAAGEAAQRALAEGESLGDACASAYALHVGATVSMHDGNLTAALGQIDHALTLTGTHPQLTDLHLALLSDRAPVANELGRPQEAIEALRQARFSAERIASPHQDGIRLRAAEIAFLHGSWDDAVAELDGLTDESDVRNSSLRRHGLAALIALRRHDRPRATPHLDALGNDPIPPGSSQFAGYLLAAQAIDREQTGDLSGAVDVLRQLLAPGNAMMRPGMCYWLTSLTRTALVARDHQLAGMAAELCRDRAERSLRADNDICARWCAGLVRGDPAPVLAAAEHYRTADRRPDLGMALEDAAVLLAGAGDGDGARRALDESLSLYTELGAVWDARRARARARAHNLRPGIRGPRRRPKSGWQALTPTELRVADLVAQARSNPEIAENLLISRHTVESHVKNILAKLQLRSRREILGFRDRIPPDRGQADHVVDR